MKKIFSLHLLLFLTLVACRSQPSESAVQTAIAQTQVAMPTATIVPSPTPIVYKSPANQYLPTVSDIPSGYKLDTDSKVVKQLDNPPSGAAVSYVTNRNLPLLGAHDGSPTSFIYFVAIGADKNKAINTFQEMTKPSNNDALFSAIAPETRFGALGHATALNITVDDCQDLKAYKAYGSLLAPTVYIVAICRIENVVGIYWSYAIDNYDGQGQHIPDEVLVQQTQELVSILTQTIK